jgi:cyclopropane-fatty-acyl-phospholipid synthase
VAFIFSFSSIVCYGEMTCSEILRSDSTIVLNSSTAETVATDIFKAAGVNFSGSRTGDITINDPEFFPRLLADPDLQIGETYMDQMWDSPAIDELSYKLMSAQLRDGRLRTFLPMWHTPKLAALAMLKQGYRYYRARLTNRQTRGLSKNVAVEHYDVGNELYRRMLDPTLTYTSGVWADGFDLEDAQNAKYDLIARKLNLKPGEHVLDIGSGFGGFARFAAKHYGAKVTGITISVEQLKTARALSADFKNINFIFSDYRDIPYRFPPNTFDHVVSIEMIEAVGVKNLKTYFDAAASSLKLGGHFVVQAIANNEDVFNTNAWFSKYIFRDGVAPSSNQVDRAARFAFGPPVDRHRITGDYDKTLMAWHANFTKAWPDLQGAYGARFKRMWDFYLLSVAGGFRARAIQLNQVVYVKGGAAKTTPPVRNLPSRSDLDKMRLSADEILKTQNVIGDLELKKQ